MPRPNSTIHTIHYKIAVRNGCNYPLTPTPEHGTYLRARHHHEQKLSIELLISVRQNLRCFHVRNTLGIIVSTAAAPCLLEAMELCSSIERSHQQAGNSGARIRASESPDPGNGNRRIRADSSNSQPNRTWRYNMLEGRDSDALLTVRKHGHTATTWLGMDAVGKIQWNLIRATAIIRPDVDGKQCCKSSGHIETYYKKLPESAGSPCSNS